MDALIPAPSAPQVQRREKFREILINLLTEKGPMGSRDLVDYTGSKIGKVRDYMNKLVNEGRANSELIPNPRNAGRTVIALYSVGDGARTVASDSLKQSSCRIYPPNHRRDFLVTALFGPAKQHGEMTK